VTAPTGAHLIAGRAEPGTGAPFAAIDPLRGTGLDPVYREAGPEQIEAAAAAAAAAAPVLRALPGTARAALLRAIAEGLEAAGEPLLQRVAAETALPLGRLQNERTRTVNQLRQFAALVAEGSWVDARIDRGDPQRAGTPKPDLRRMLVALGPVAVFGASNFPLAYSVAGGDTASALAAGCPVLVKGHPAHPGTSELVGRVVQAAVQAQGLPPGTFALLHGREPATGAALVQHPAVAAVGFTGSHRAGRALFDLAAGRSAPIPVFAEMGSMNPVLVLPGALRERGPALAGQLADSALLAMGQFCTSPGLVLWCEGPGAAEFAAALGARLQAAPAGPTVHPSIRAGYEQALAEVRALPVQVAVAPAGAASAATAVCPALVLGSGDLLQRFPRLRHEIYGPAVLGAPCRDAGELLAVVQALDGHLTGTVHGTREDFVEFHAVIDALRSKVGRLIANGVPTGVEVCSAMVHGGPYPAATDARFSAVGVTSIQRWVRPVCWQDWPAELLPPELRDDNPLGIRRTVDGDLRG
jgi:NADP-dependent aldehyde dehydrogenase